MKLSNEKRKFYFQIIGTIFIMALLFIAFLMVVSVGKIRYSLLAYLGGVIVLYLFHKWRGYPFFIYDSDGETLNFTNKDYYLMFGDPKVVKRAEFPKRKLLNYKVRDLIFKKELLLTVQSKRSSSEKTIQKFDITYLKNSEIKDLKKSLDKVVKHNKENISVDNGAFGE